MCGPVGGAEAGGGVDDSGPAMGEPDAVQLREGGSEVLGEGREGPRIAWPLEKQRRLCDDLIAWIDHLATV